MGRENVDLSKSKKHSTASLEQRFFTVSYLVPFNVEQSKWQEFVRKQFVEHQIAAIREEIIDTATVDALERCYFEKRSFEFVSQCLRISYLQLFDWVFLRLDRSKRQASQKNDVEPQPSLIDSWILRNVSQNFFEKSSFSRM